MPACRQAGYEPESYHNDVTTDLVAVNKYHLERAPMVIADLGIAPWNENVMMEVGYRFVSKKPIVLIRDTPQDENDDLPFLLRPYRVIQLPPEGSDLSDELRTELKQLAINNIVKLLRWEEKKYSSWHSAHAMAVVEVDCQTQEETYIETNQYAQDMLSPDGGSMLGIPGEDITDSVLEWMEKNQVPAFAEDQGRVYEELFAGDTNVISTIPLVFSNRHPREEFRNKSFKPIIIQNEVFRLDDGSKKFYVRILYLDVTDSVWLDKHGVRRYAESGKAVLNRKSRFPLTTVKFDLSRKQSMFVDANTLATELLQGYRPNHHANNDENVVHKLLGETGEMTAEQLEKWMPTRQAELFRADQERIYEELYKGNTDVEAKYPLVFSREHPLPEYRNRKFRPILVQHEDLELQDKTKRMYVCVMFMDVTNSVRYFKDEGEFHFVECDCLKCTAAKQVSYDDSSQTDTLLFYSPPDEVSVGQVYQQLVDNRVSAWFDVKALSGQEDAKDQANVDRAIQNTKSVVVFFGNNDRRKVWEHWGARTLVAECRKLGIPVIPVLIPGAAYPDYKRLNLRRKDFVRLADVTDDIDTLLARLQSVLTAHPVASGKPKIGKPVSEDAP